ncbi:autotransporter family protein [Pasteurella sp. P03HT]
MMKNTLSLISIAILSSLYTTSAFSTDSATSCGDGCTKEEIFDTTKNTSQITIHGNRDKKYDIDIMGSKIAQNYKIINHANIHRTNAYNIYVAEGRNALNIEVFNTGKLVAEGTDPTSSIDAQWGNILEKLQVTNSGEIRTEGEGGNECAICSRYFKRSPAGNTIKTPTEVIYEINNLGNTGVISANQGSTIWLENGKSAQIYNEGMIVSKSLKEAVIDINYTAQAYVENRGTIKSSDNQALLIHNTTQIDVHNTGRLESGNPDKTLVLLHGDHVSFTNKGELLFTREDTTKRNRALTLNGSKESNLTLSTGSKIGGIVKANPNNSHLILEKSGEENGTIHDQSKFANFNHLIMRGDIWTLSDAFEFSRMINIATGKLILKDGSLTAPNLLLQENTALDFTTDYVLKGHVENQGSFNFVHQDPTLTFKTVTIQGDYQGQDGSLHLLTTLGNGTNETDRLLIKGKATGSTQVVIDQLESHEETPIVDVKVIETTNSAPQAFMLDRYLVKDAWLYNLEKRQENHQENWYLTNYIHQALNYRPEMAGYANNLYAANHLFNLRLEDRLMRHNFLSQAPEQTFWLRLVKGTTRNQMADLQNKAEARKYMIQLGKDIITAPHYKLGVMFGYGKQNTKIQARYANVSRAKVQGYAAGIYATWYQNIEQDTGFYVDGWLQHQWLKNQVINPVLTQENYHSRGFNASIETGYTYPVSQYRVNDWEHRFTIQPQAQLMWQGVRAKQHRDQQGTLVESLGNNNVQTRLGIKLSLDSHLSTQQFNIKPYFEFNWLHNSNAYGASMNGIENYIQGTHNLMEYKAGLESQVSHYVQFWLDTTHRRGQHDFKENQLNLGIKVLF